MSLNTTNSIILVLNVSSKMQIFNKSKNVSDDALEVKDISVVFTSKLELCKSTFEVECSFFSDPQL